MIFFTAAAPPFMKNGFVLGCERTREAIVIDPGDDVEDLLRFVDAEQVKPTAILLTHAHLDHVSGVGTAKRRLAVPVWLHRDDQPLYDNVVMQGAMFGIRVDPQPPIDGYYPADPVWGRFGDYEVSVHHTPGHAPGGVCLAVHRVEPQPALEGLFVGDTLFAGSIGRTDLPGGDYETLMTSITKVLFTFPDEAVVYSGHGPETTIGRERRTNPFVLEYSGRAQGSGNRS